MLWRRTRGGGVFESIDVLTGLSTGLDLYEGAEDSLTDWLYIFICAMFMEFISSVQSIFKVSCTFVL